MRDTLGGVMRRVALPLGAYYGVTLVLPLANGAAEAGGAFFDHALMVLVVPLALIAIVGAIRGCARLLGRAMSLRGSAVAAYVGAIGPRSAQPVPLTAAAGTGTGRGRRAS